MNGKLRIIDNINIIEEHDGVAFSGQLVCDCNCNLFDIYHTGKKTKGILAPYLIKNDKQIVIKAVCKKCGKVIVVYDSKIDGLNPSDQNIYLEEKFTLQNGNDGYEIILKYNYYLKDFKTNKFYDCFIEVKNEKMKRLKPLYEGV